MAESDKIYFTYVLYSSKHDQLYIDRRFYEHCSGKVPSTRPYLPYRILYTEEYKTKTEAVFREKELKSSTGRRFLRKLL